MRLLHSQQLWVPLRTFRLFSNAGAPPAANSELLRGSVPGMSVMSGQTFSSCSGGPGKIKTDDTVSDKIEIHIAP